MKFFTLTLCFVSSLYYGMAKVIPDRLPQPCSKSVPDYNDCSLNFLRKFKSHMINGISELNIPTYNPFHLPIYLLNRTINNTVSISALITEGRIWGFDTMEIKSFKFDHETLSGEVGVYFPKVRVGFEYNAVGELPGPLPLTDSGYCKGNLTEVNVEGTFNYTTIKKVGVKYFTLDNVQVTGDHIENANIVKMISKVDGNQRAVDFISNFINEDPQRTIKALSPVLRESGAIVARQIVEPILSVIPANELIPE